MPVDRLRELFGHLPCKFIQTSVRSAEMMKYCCNNFHALKITFANETARLCNALGVDPFEVMDLVCQDTQLNISRAYLKPGFAFGGSRACRRTCAPRRTWHARTMWSSRCMRRSCRPTRRTWAWRCARYWPPASARIGFIGLSFKTGTDDLRESPLVTLAEQLIGKGMQLAIYDPEVHLAQLLGSNRRYIEQHLPHIGQLLCADLEQVIDASDVLVLGQGGEKVRSSLTSLSRTEQLVVDLIGFVDPRDAARRRSKACVGDTSPGGQERKVQEASYGGGARSGSAPWLRCC